MFVGQGDFKGGGPVGFVHSGGMSEGKGSFATASLAKHLLHDPFVQSSGLALCGLVGVIWGIISWVPHFLKSFIIDDGDGNAYTSILLLLGGFAGFLALVRKIAAGVSISKELLEITDLRGKICVVTGGNAGIGRETCRQLARWGAKVIMASRNENKAKDAITDIKKSIDKNPGKYGAESQIDFMHLNLADFASVREFAEKIRNMPLYALVNNAGLVGGAVWAGTEQGHELSIGTNHLGHFLLVKCLMDGIISNSTRVINISSMAHILSAPKAGLDVTALTPEYSKAYYDAATYYGISKLCNLLFTQELQSRFDAAGSKACAYAVHPGVVATNFFDQFQVTSPDERGFVKTARDLTAKVCVALASTFTFKNAIAGAQTTLYLLAEKQPFLKPGAYYKDCQCFPPGPSAAKINTQKDLWDYSEQAVAGE